MARAVYTPAGGSTGLEWTTHDLSTFTKLDPNSLEDSATLGSSSNITIATNHGRADAGLDGLLYYQVLESSVDWSDYHGMSAEVTCSTWPANGGGTGSFVHVGLLSAASQTSGLLAGLRIQSGGAYNHSVMSIGSGPTDSGTNVGTPDWVRSDVLFDDDGMAVASAHVKGAGGNQRTTPKAAAVNATDLILVLAFGNGGTPSSTITYTGMVLKTALITEPT